MKQMSRKNFLILDDCAAHLTLDCQTNIQFQFLQQNTTVLFQPKDKPIINNLKSFCRRNFVRNIFEKIENNMLSSSATAPEISSAVNTLQAMQFNADRCTAVNSKTIWNSFRSYRFERTELKLNAQDSEDQGAVEVQLVENYEQCDSTNVAVSCYKENDHCEDDILHRIAERNKILCKP